MDLAGAGARHRGLPEADDRGGALDAEGFFSRRRLSLPSRDPGFLTAECPNLDEFLFLPVTMGLWRQHELWDGTYTLDNLLDAVELICVRRENEKRAADAARV